MENSPIQQALFSHIKGLVPANIAFVDAVAEVLDISNDSAYRRIRGEKPISLEEVRLLAHILRYRSTRYYTCKAMYFFLQASLLIMLTLLIITGSKVLYPT